MADSNITVSGLLRLATNRAYMATGFQPMRDMARSRHFCEARSGAQITSSAVCPNFQLGVKPPRPYAPRW
jgi:hypothetical protein